jgi:GR25 family glycosyltransferase involved in LPS biosynthesis
MLLSATKECSKIGLPFERISAVNGLELQAPSNQDTNDPKYWNRGALALSISTVNVLEDAKRNGYKNILILEDDIEFNPLINEYVKKYWKHVPLDMQMFNFGVQNTIEPVSKNDFIKRIVFGFCCHCYMINESIYDIYLKYLYAHKKQIDLITCEDIQPIGTTYAFNHNLAYQKNKYSDINEKIASRDFLRK